MSEEILEDTEFQDTTIQGVGKHDEYYSIKRADGWSFSFKDVGIEPKIGDRARFYGRGIGSTVRGLFINGQKIFYRTPEEQKEQFLLKAIKRDNEKKAKFEANREAMDADFAALPENFQARINRFRTNNPDFRWEMESYELFCCKEALKISDAFESGEAINEFSKLKFSEQKQLVDIDDGHSGNTFRCAVRLAFHQKTNPELVAKEHGALCMLVGCASYGCVRKESIPEGNL